MHVAHTGVVFLSGHDKQWKTPTEKKAKEMDNGAITGFKTIEKSLDVHTSGETNQYSVYGNMVFLPSSFLLVLVWFFFFHFLCDQEIFQHREM